MIMMILTNIKDSKQLLEMLNRLSKKYNGLHYKMAEAGYEIYINNNMEVPQEFDQYLKDTLKEINTELLILKTSSVAFLPLKVNHFRDELIEKFNTFEDKSMATIKRLCIVRYHSSQQRVEKLSQKSTQKKEVSHDPFAFFNNPTQRPTFGNHMSSPMHSRGISGLSSGRPMDPFGDERKKQIDMQNARIMSDFELGMQKEQEEQKAMAEQEKTLIIFFKLVEDIKGGKVKENLLQEWINCFNLNVPTAQFVECAEEKDQETLVKFKCVAPQRRFEENYAEKLWVDINLIHSQIKNILFNNENFGCERNIDSFETKNFSIKLTSLVVRAKSKDAIIRDLQLALINASLDSSYRLSEVICKAKPVLENKSTVNQSLVNGGVQAQPEVKESGYITDDDEVDFLEKTAKEIISKQNINSLSGLTWNKLSNQNDKLVHRVRGFSTRNPGLFQSVATLAESLEDKGIASSVLVGKNESGNATSMLLKVTLRGKA